jgi:hypothetical protein
MDECAAAIIFYYQYLEYISSYLLQIRWRNRCIRTMGFGLVRGISAQSTPFVSPAAGLG